jgi:AraC-like DNA-binding protein
MQHSFGISALHRQDMENGEGNDRHRHAEGQIYLLTRGLCVVEHASERWIMPPGIVGWIPPGTAHATALRGTIHGWAVYLAPDFCGSLPEQACGLQSSLLILPLLERLSVLMPAPTFIRKDTGTPAPLMELAPSNHVESRYRHILQVLLDELADAMPISHHLPFPHSPSLAAVARYLLDNLTDKRPIAEWAREAAMSERGFRRAFTRETAIPFSRWRRMARLMKGYELLIQGMDVQDTAWDVGYETVSAFIAGFRELFGCTPASVAKGQTERQRVTK